MKLLFVPYILLMVVGLFVYSGFLIHDQPHGNAAHHDHTDQYQAHTHRQAEEMDEKLLFPTAVPDRVILNLTETPETSVAVNWRTDTTVMEGTVEWAEATDGPEFREKPHSLQAQRELLRAQHAGDPEVVAHYFSAMIPDLSPGKKYVYRVGQGEAWSEWYQITMPQAGGPISFIYFGDAQNDVKSMWSRVIREAYKTMPKIDFMLHAGDLINRHDRDAEWGEWFYAGNFIHATVPAVMTPGNHEYGKGVVLSPQWRPQFNLPTNGPKGLEETCYAINYTNLKVISLDAEQIDESEKYRNLQAVWLDSVLTHDPRQWTAITFHYPVYSTKPNRDNEKLRAVFKPIFDKHQVDIILQGHDHAYGRGMVSNVPAGVHVKDKTSGTMYVVSVSGPKMYDVSDDPWMARKARNTQLFQLITIHQNTLTYQAYTAAGNLYDAFDLIKTKKGKANKLVNKIPAMQERR